MTGSLAVYAAFAWLRSGQLPRYDELFFFQQVFYEPGFYMVAMPSAGVLATDLRPAGRHDGLVHASGRSGEDSSPCPLGFLYCSLWAGNISLLSGPYSATEAERTSASDTDSSPQP